MLYIDNSALVPYYCPEPTSDKVEEKITQIKGPSISYLTQVEFVSAVSRKIRENTLSENDGANIIRKFEDHVERELFRLTAVEFKHFEMAKNWIAMFNTPLKTLDAIHLAIASELNLPLYTADESLAKSADKLGVDHEFLAL